MDDLFCGLISIFGGVEVSLSPPWGGGFTIPSGTRGVNGGEFSPIPDDFKFVLYPNYVIKPKFRTSHHPFHKASCTLMLFVGKQLTVKFTLFYVFTNNRNYTEIY